MTSRGQISLVYSRGTGPSDGIGDFTERLCAALVSEGHEARIVEDLRTARAADAGEYVVLQYNPFAWGRWGIAPGLVKDLLLLRRRGGASIGVLVHEPYLPLTASRHLPFALLQRAQLRALCAQADVTMTTISAWRSQCRNRAGGWAWHVPVGSNVPDQRSARENARRAIGAGTDDVVVAYFPSRHPGWSSAHVEAALERLRDRRDVLLLRLGSGSHPLTAEAGFRSHSTGVLDAMRLGQSIAAADVFLAPFADGVSTRRTTVMAALQHEVAVAATAGPLTDQVFYERGPALAPVDALDAFAVAVERLVGNSGERERCGVDGRALYADEFDWPRVTDRFLHAAR